MSRPTLTLTAVPGIPDVEPGDDLPAMIAQALDAAGIEPREQDVLAVSHKIISKAEDRYVDLADVTPSAVAYELAERTEKDPRLVEVILSESRKVLRDRPGLIITEHRLGWVMANAGVDQSNVPSQVEGERVLRLPEDPDGASARIRDVLERRFEVKMGVVVCDSVGRAWRHGVVGFALGASGLPALLDLRGARDRQGRELKVSFAAVADQIASAAELVMGEADEGQPVVLLRGLTWSAAALPAAALVRSPDEDLFR